MSERLLRMAFGYIRKPKSKPKPKAKPALTRRQKASKYERAKALQRFGHMFLRINTDACCYCGDYATEGDHRPSLFACWKRAAKPCSLVGSCAKCNAALGTSPETNPAKLITLAMLRTDTKHEWRRRQMIRASRKFQTMACWARSDYMRVLSADRCKEKTAFPATLQLPATEIRLPYKE